MSKRTAIISYFKTEDKQKIRDIFAYDYPATSEKNWIYFYTVYNTHWKETKKEVRKVENKNKVTTTDNVRISESTNTATTAQEDRKRRNEE